MIDLKFDHVSKRYLIQQEDADHPAQHSLIRKLQSLRRRREDFWAVRDVSFEVERGEALGIIGHNGAGKSTILKLLANITTPTSGEITINGRLSALIEVGSGFHPELSGRENVFLSGSILGMRRAEIATKLDSIVEFAGVRQFIDTPVKRYSSGMYVRLGFAIAAHLDPDILLLDEVLAVGDAAFQAKCMERIKELRETGTTIVFISHDLGAVERLCSRAILMHRGQIAASGSPREVIAEYQSASAQLTSSAPPKTATAILDNKAEITSLTFYDSEGHQTSAVRTGDSLTARLGYKVHEAIDDAAFELFFQSTEGGLLCHLTTELSDKRLDLTPGTGEVEFTCGEFGLLPDMYHLDATIIRRNQPPGNAIDWQYRCTALRVDPGKAIRGKFYMPHEWQITLTGGAEHSGQTATPSLEVLAPT